jgi:hypothetical protein
VVYIHSQAIPSWAINGIRENLTAWLYTVSKNQAKDLSNTSPCLRIHKNEFDELNKILFQIAFDLIIKFLGSWPGKH